MLYTFLISPIIGLSRVDTTFMDSCLISKMVSFVGGSGSTNYKAPHYASFSRLITASNYQHFPFLKRTQSV